MKRIFRVFSTSATVVVDEYAVPDPIKKFVVSFYKNVKERNVIEILNHYEGTFQKLAERYFRASAWPSAELIAGLVENSMENGVDNIVNGSHTYFDRSIIFISVQGVVLSSHLC